LAKACLAPAPQDRPRDARAVAERVAAYLAGVQERLRRAELERASAQARAEEAGAKAAVERRARRLTIGLATAGLALALLVGGGWLWFKGQQEQLRQADLELAAAEAREGETAAKAVLAEARANEAATKAALERAAEAERRQQQTDQAVALALGEARLLREQAKAAPPAGGGKSREALAAARKADELARTGVASEAMQQQATALVGQLKQETEAAERDRQMAGAVEEIRLRQAELTGAGRSYNHQQIDRAYAEAFQNYGLPVVDLTAEEAADRIRQRAIAVPLALAPDDWALQRRARPLRKRISGPK
jgi:eukaryotic-like serine/threonine-protein kinase